MDQRLIHRRRVRWVAMGILFLAAVVLRVGRAGQEVIANPDVVRYVEQAQGLARDPVGTMRAEVYHPLHAAMGFMVHAVIGGWFVNERMGWIWALRWVGILAGAGVTVEIVMLARMLGAPWWAAMGAAMAFLVGRRTSVYGSDGLSDMLALVLFGGAMLVGLRAMRFRRGVDWERWVWAGVLSGLAYLVRPEGLAAVVILGVTLGLMAVGRRMAMNLKRAKLFPRRRVAGWIVVKSLGCLVVGAMVVAGPYMVITHRVTGKVGVAPGAVSLVGDGGFAEHAQGPYPEHGTRVSDTWSGMEVVHPEVWGKVGMELMETFFWPGVVVLVGAMGLKPWAWGRPRVRLAVVVWAGVWGAVMVWLLLWSGKGYLDGRHTLPLQLLLFGMLGLALAVWRRPMIWWMGWWRRRPEAWGKLPGWMRWRKWSGVFGGCVMGLMLVPGVVELGVRPRADKACVLEAVQWIEGNTNGDVVVCDEEKLLGYYSMRGYARWTGTAGRPELGQLEDVKRGHGGAFIVGRRYEVGKGEKVAEAIGPYREMKVFEAGGEAMVLYVLPGEWVLKK